MAVNKPIGDNARKGAMKKLTQLKNPLTAHLEVGVDQPASGRLREPEGRIAAWCYVMDYKPTASQPRSLLSMAILNNARSRILPQPEAYLKPCRGR